MRALKINLAVFFFIAIITLVSTVNAQIFLINNNLYETTNGYFTETQLREIGFNIVKNDRIYLIYNKKLIIGSNGDLLVDFEQYYPRTYIITNGSIFVKQDFIISLLKLNKLSDNFYYDKPITITSVNFANGSLIITTTTAVKKEIVNIFLSNNILSVSITPAQTDVRSSNGISITKMNNTVKIELQNKIADYSIQYLENKIVIYTQSVGQRFTYDKRTESFAGRTFNVNYLIIDPKQSNITPLLSSKGVGTTETLLDILKANGYSAGTNANYFDPATGLPIDIIISNGKVLSHRYGLRPIFVQTVDNRVFIRKAYLDITVRIGDVLLLVKGVNTTSPGEVNIYTEEYNLKVPNDASKSYIVVKNEKVSSIGYVSKVPSGSQVIMISNELFKKFFSTLSVGTRVTYEMYTDDGSRVKNAVGAGPLLLQNGEIIPDASEEKLRYGGGIPTSRTNRTIIAIKDGKVYLMTIEGLSGVGMNFDEAAQFLKSKRFESAMMLDGGSSTAMVYGGKYVTTGTPRNIPVALGVR